MSLECSLYTGECSLDTSAPIGDIIRIATPERQYVYVITRQVTVHDAIWEAQWPD